MEKYTEESEGERGRMGGGEWERERGRERGRRGRDERRGEEKLRSDSTNGPTGTAKTHEPRMSSKSLLGICLF